MSSVTNILIVENDSLIAENIKSSLQKDGFNISGVAVNFKNAVDSMKKQPADLAVIDIRLDGPEDGISTAKELLKIKWIPIIYITGESLRKSAERSKNTFPAAFLEKPLRMTELSVQIDLALHNFRAGNLPAAESQNADHIFVHSQKGYIRIRQEEILYMTADRIYSKLFLTEAGFQRLHPGRPYTFVHVSMNLGRVFRQLSSQFYQLSRSVVVNLDFIDRIDSENLFIADHQLPIPEGTRQVLMNRLGIVKNR